MAVTPAVIGATAAVAGTANSIAKGSGAGKTQSQANAAGQQAQDYAQQAFNLFQNLQTPTFNRTPMQTETWLQDYQPVGYDPYIGQVTRIQDSPQMRADQLAALAQEQALAKGGLQPADLIALEQIQQSQAGAASSQAASAADALRNRGLGGAGAEYASRLAANQNASNQASSLYDQAMQAAMNRQLQAIQQSGTMAGNIRTQDVGVSKTMADIQDQFNTEVQNIRNAAAQYTAQTQNAAQAANLAGRQGVANANVGINNQNLAYQNQLSQQDFANQTTKLTDEANALNRQQTLASANQAALNNQALGQENATQTGLTGLSNIASSIGNVQKAAQNDPNSWWNGIFGSNNNTPTNDINSTPTTPDETAYVQNYQSGLGVA
jgi:hypothetical protein